MKIEDAPSMDVYKRERLKELVLWGHITQAQANKEWRKYLKLFNRTTKQQKQRGEKDKWWID